MIYCWELTNDGFIVTDTSISQNQQSAGLLLPCEPLIVCLLLTHPWAFSPPHIPCLDQSLCYMKNIHNFTDINDEWCECTLTFRRIIGSDTQEFPCNCWHFCGLRSMFFFFCIYCFSHQGTLSLTSFLYFCLSLELLSLIHALSISLTVYLFLSWLIVSEYLVAWLSLRWGCKGAMGTVVQAMSARNYIYTLY